MNDCPYCDPKPDKYDPFLEQQCPLNKPLMICIPPEGMHISCPIHPKGHYLQGQRVWM